MIPTWATDTAWGSGGGLFSAIYDRASLRGTLLRVASGGFFGYAASEIVVERILNVPPTNTAVRALISVTLGALALDLISLFMERRRSIVALAAERVGAAEVPSGIPIQARPEPPQEEPDIIRAARIGDDS